MELLTSIEMDGASRCGRLVGLDGSSRTVEISELARRGIPFDGLNQPHRSATQFQLNTHLHRWSRCSLDDFAAAVGLPANIGGHTGWTFTEAGTTFVIPTLVVLRALVRPNPSLFPQLLRPQSLDDICTYLPDRNTVWPWVKHMNKGAGRIKAGKRLTWFYCFPSARLAWGSVLRYAALGRLDWDPPEASAVLCVNGVRVGDTRYITKMVTMAVRAEEEPFEFAAKQSRDIEYQPELSSVDELLTSTGSRLTDAEWALIEPLLYAPRATNVQKAVAEHVLLAEAVGIKKHYIFPTTTSVERILDAQAHWRLTGRLARAKKALTDARQSLQ